MNRVRELRTERGLTQKELGELIGRSNHAVQKWEKGDSSIPEDIIVNLCTILGTTADYLLCRTDVNTRRIELRGDQLPQELRDAGLDYVQMLREYVDTQGGIRPDVRRELLRLVAEAKDLPDDDGRSARRRKQQNQT
jgi:transcriptional regulator with XRE-family HTH domain